MVESRTFTGGAGQSGWDSWAETLCNATEHGGRLLGVAHGTRSGAAAEDPQVAIKGRVRQGMAEAILMHAEASRARGERPMLLSNLLMTARAVCPACEPPAQLLRAIGGWAGARGEHLSTIELDDLWSSLLATTRTRRHDANAANLADSFLPRGLNDAPSESRAVQPRRRGGKKKKKKKKKKKGGYTDQSGDSRQADDGSEDEDGDEQAAADPEACADPPGEPLPPSPANDCPICVDAISGMPAVMPCAGRHMACFVCIREWRATCVLNTVEFSCPMCRESLEGWEP